MKKIIKKAGFVSLLLIYLIGSFSTTALAAGEVDIEKCDTGMDNVFQINFVSPYYMIRKMLPELKKSAAISEICKREGLPSPK